MIQVKLQHVRILAAAKLLQLSRQIPQSDDHCNKRFSQKELVIKLANLGLKIAWSCDYHKCCSHQARMNLPVQLKWQPTSLAMAGMVWQLYSDKLLPTVFSCVKIRGCCKE
uniref:Uncharacterized protein n=1 Tax=Parascaris univalens TaxID=6257 RepID=A0A915AVP2_PARUN